MKRKFKLLSSWETKEQAAKSARKAAYTIAAQGKAGEMAVKVEETGSASKPWEVWLYKL